MILDIGCGIYTKYNKFVKGENVVHADVDKNSYHIEIQCDIHHLPFVDSTFQMVYASHILEHIINPYMAIGELRRVTNGKVVVKVPNASFYKARNSGKGHLYSWNEWTLRYFLEQFFSRVEISETSRWSLWVSKLTKLQKVKLIVERTFFNAQSELTAVCYKREKT